MMLIESTSAKVHEQGCFHVGRNPTTVYKVLFASATKEQVREYIQVKKKQGQCCGSCLAWAVTSG